jgi:guanine deaminase
MNRAQMGRSLFLGTFIHSRNLEELDYLYNTAVCVNEDGVIVAIEPECDLAKAEEQILPKLGWSRGDVSVRIAKPGEFFFPGFIGKCAIFNLRFF